MKGSPHIASRWAARAQRSSGFSLLELLLVLVVVGLLVSIAGLSVSSGSRTHRIEGAVGDFRRLAEYAMDQAQLGGFDIGLLVEPAGDGGLPHYRYQWLRRQGQQWVRFANDELLLPQREFPPGLALELEVEDAPLPMDTQRKVSDPPQVIYYGSGEATPGVLRWRDAGSDELLWQLDWDLLGQLQLRRWGGEEDERRH